MTALQKKIGFWTATSIVVGSIIGSGVFMKPSAMAAELGSPVWMSLIWLIAGIFSFFGALVFSELGAMMPETGGLYIYFKRTFGDFFASLYGWSAFSVINTASIAAISIVFAEYANYFLHLPRFDIVTEHSFVIHLPFIGDFFVLENFGVKSLAAVSIIIFSWLNYRSLKAGGSFQLISTIVKVGVLAALIFGILFSGQGSVANFFEGGNPKTGSAFVQALVVALTGAFFAYDGWINVGYIAGEIKSPQKNVVKSLLFGVSICMIIYLLINQAYLYVLPIDQVAQSKLVAADAIGVAWGAKGEAVIAALIVICTLGSVNGNIMSVCRVTYAMGKDKVFFAWAGKEHPRFATPGNAVWLHAVWTILFIYSGSFNMLADMMIFITWLSYGLGAVALMVLRKRNPEMERPYKVWGYPVVPLLFILFSAFYLVITLQNDIRNYINHQQPIINSLLGLIITALGIPIYFYCRYKYRPKIMNH